MEVGTLVKVYVNWYSIESYGLVLNVSLNNWIVHCDGEEFNTAPPDPEEINIVTDIFKEEIQNNLVTRNRQFVLK